MLECLRYFDMAEGKKFIQFPWVSDEEMFFVSGKRFFGAEQIQGATLNGSTTRFYRNAEHTEWSEAKYDESKAGLPGRDYTLPDPLTFNDGHKVKNAADWALRRRELLDIFEQNVYGKMPKKPETMPFELLSEKDRPEFAMVERRYRTWFRTDKTGPVIDWIVLAPTAEFLRPCPVFLHLNYLGLDKIASGNTNHFPIPLGEMAARGYALMSAHYTQISWDGPDHEGNPFDGVFELWGPRDPKRTDNPGAIMAWAWGLCRGLDLAEQIPELDATRAVAIGSSRLGKAALLAAAFDERFKVCVANQTGAIGAQLLRHDFGETIGIQEIMFPWWYCSGVWQWAGREREMPFDQHELLACIAPRALLLESFCEPWFDPVGEFLSVKAASPVWEMLTGKGLRLDEWPALHDDSAVHTPFGYARRDGEHGLSPYDWHWAFDFAKEIF